MYIFGICGRSGSGKSTACRLLEKRGFYWLDTDKSCRKVYENPNCIDELVRAFGDGILSDGKIDRGALARYAFSSPENTKKLNAISHKYILEDIFRDAKAVKAQGYKYLLVDAPLLFEAGLQDKCDAVIAVVAPETASRKRLVLRDGIDEETLTRRLAAQKSNAFLVKNADAVILNNGTLKVLEMNTYKAVFKLFLKLRICKSTKEVRRYVKK